MDMRVALDGEKCGRNSVEATLGKQKPEPKEVIKVGAGKALSTKAVGATEC